MILLLLATAAPSPARAAGEAGGTSDRRSRDAARQAIQWRSLDEAERRRVAGVVSGATLYRKLPTRVIDCDPQMFAYLIAHPELVVDAWGVMGISKLSVDRVGPDRYRAGDATGTVGDVRVLHSSGGGARPLTVLVDAVGVYDAPPMPRPLRARSVLLLRAESFLEANGRTYVRADLDSFVDFDSPTTALVAKTLQPLVMKTADHNFVETMRFVSLFSRTAERNPEGMARLAASLTKTDPATRREFAAVCAQTADRYAVRREQREWVGPLRQAAAARPAVVR